MNVPRLGAALALACIASTATVAQAPGIQRTLLQRIDLGDGRELVMGIAEIAPGASTGRHTHSGIETGYALAGDSSLEIEGEAPRRMTAGQSYLIPAGKVHDAKALGSGPAKVLAIYVVEKGKPLAVPAK